MAIGRALANIAMAPVFVGQVGQVSDRAANACDAARRWAVNRLVFAVRGPCVRCRSDALAARVGIAGSRPMRAMPLGAPVARGPAPTRAMPP
jgi:hypothetical protein